LRSKQGKSSNINADGEVVFGVVVDKAAFVKTAIDIEDFPEDGEYGNTTSAQYEFVIASLNQRYKRLWLYVQMQRNLASSSLKDMFLVRAIINQIDPDTYHKNSEIDQVDGKKVDDVAAQLEVTLRKREGKTNLAVEGSEMVFKDEDEVREDTINSALFACIYCIGRYCFLLHYVRHLLLLQLLILYTSLYS
jgi:hypothetical protein